MTKHTTESTPTPTMTPTVLSNAVVDADRQVDAIQATVRHETGRLREAALQLRDARTAEHRQQAAATISEASDAIADQLSQLSGVSQQLGALAKQMPVGSIAAGTGAVGSVGGGTGVAGVPGSADDRLPAATDEAEGTGIHGLSHDEINPDDKRSAKHKGKEK